MYRKTFFLSLLFLGALIAATFFYFTRLGPSDLMAYHSLKNLSETEPEEKTSSRQNKQKVRKEIGTHQGDKRFLTRILSESSKMTLERVKGKNEVREEMENVTALMHEAIDKESQIIRALVAAQATYYFKEDRLVAEKVRLYRYELPGNELPEGLPSTPPLMHGEASWAEFFLKEGRIDLNASEVSLHSLEKKTTASAQSLLFDGKLALLEGEVKIDHPLGQATSEAAEVIYDQEQDKGLSEAKLLRNVVFTRSDGSKLTCQKADFNMKELRCEGPSVLTRIDEVKKKSYTITTPGVIYVDNVAKKTYLMRSEEAQVHYSDLFGEIYADKVTITYEPNEKKIKHILMEDKVFMAHSLPSEVERSYAYADRAEYLPDTFEMILEGDRVLVYDKINQVEISAPKIRVQRDQATKKETVHGEGDVRFTLEEKEFQALKNRFKLEENK